jgi:hypothetical protein
VDAAERQLERDAQHDFVSALRVLWERRRRGVPFVRFEHLEPGVGDLVLVHEIESPWSTEDWLGEVLKGDKHMGWYVRPLLPFVSRFPVSHKAIEDAGRKGLYVTRSDTAIKL